MGAWVPAGRSELLHDGVKTVATTGTQPLLLGALGSGLAEFAQPRQRGSVVWQARAQTDAPVFIDQIGHMNICVGPNNSGKSRFLRFLALAKELFEVNLPDPLPVLKAVRDHLDEADRSMQIASVIEPERAEGMRAIGEFRTFIDSLEADPGGIRWRTDIESPPGLGAFTGVEVEEPAKVNALPKSARAVHGSVAHAVSVFESLRRAVSDDLKSLLGSKTPIPRVIYIPSLRTLRRLGTPARGQMGTIDLYFTHAYGLPTEGGFELFTGVTIYHELRELALGGAEGRRRLLAFENFLSRTCFGGRSVGVSPKGDGEQGHVEVEVEGDKPYHLDHLGDGIAQLIVLAFPVFFDPERLFLVEEPETHLHPGLQRAVLHLYATTAQGPVFITTHSNHLLDMAAEASRQATILRFRKSDAAGGERKSFNIEVVPVDDLLLLNDLGVQVSSVARVNTVIWVEGTTDRKYLQALLRLCDSAEHPLLEHLHYGFVEYGGSSVVHYAFGEASVEDRIRVLRIGGKPIVIADTDAGKDARHAGLRAELGDGFQLTPGREIENLLPPPVLRAVLLTYGEDPVVVDDVLGVAFRDEPLGSWLDARFAGRSKRRGNYGDASGTISDKLTFCNRGVEALAATGSAALSEEVVRWVEGILQQVREANGLSA